MRIQGIVFDRDQVLAYWDLPGARSFFAAEFSLSAQQLFADWEMLGREINFPRNVAEESEFFRTVWAQIGERYDLPTVDRRKLRDLDYARFLLPFPETRGVLEELRAKDLKIGVLSNFPLASLERSLEKLKLADLIDAACAAQVIGASKPDARAYRIVAEMLNVRPEECLFFDNKPQHVEGARATGMSAYLVDRGRVGHDVDAGIVKDLRAVPEIVDRFGKD